MTISKATAALLLSLYLNPNHFYSDHKKATIIREFSIEAIKDRDRTPTMNMFPTSYLVVVCYSLLEQLLIDSDRDAALMPL